MKALLLPILVCCSAISFAQPSSAGTNGENRPVTLNVVVRDKSGMPIASLDRQNFTIFDNKQPVAVTSFGAVGGATGRPPVQIIVVLDEVNATWTVTSFERTQLLRFLRMSNGRLPLPVSLAFLTDAATKIPGTPSLDGNALIAALNEQQFGLRTERRSEGLYGAGDRMQTSLRALEQIASLVSAKPGRKIVIWISPGWELLTTPHIDWMFTNKTQKTIFHNVVSISEVLRLSDMTIYCVDPLGTGDTGGFATMYYRNFLKGVREPADCQFAHLSLQVIATQSGGRVLNSSNDVAGEIASCFRDAAAFYRLSFDSSVARNPDEFHAIEVKVSKPGLTALTRTGYYAQP